MPTTKKKTSKKPKGSSKGYPFEREVCKKLSLWWTNGKRDDVFWRTSGSGARATSRTKKKQETFGQYGDVQATDPIGQPLIDAFTIEIKRGCNKATASNLLDSSARMSEQQFLSFVAQATRSCMEAGSWAWAIIHKRDQREILITLPYRATGIIENLETSYLLLNIQKKKEHKNHRRSLIVVQMLFNDFLLSTTPERIKNNEKYRYDRAC